MRPVAEILEQAQRENWPTSYIDAMANHHLCSRWFRDSGDEGPPDGAVPVPDPDAGTAPPKQPHSHVTETSVPNKTCPVCSGSGNDPNTRDPGCSECDSSGTIVVSDGSSY